MSEQPFLQLYVGDYLADTLDLTTEEHGAYLLLLMTMWRHGAKLPNDRRKLARICRLTPAKFDRVWGEISRFFDVSGDDITQKRLTKEHEKAQEKSRIRADAGAKGGRAKALKSNERGEANATDLPPVLPKHSSEPEPESEEKEEDPKGSSKKKRGSRLPDDWVLPKDWGDWALSQQWPESAVRAEAEKFRDFWVSKSGRDATKLDWQATWRNWMRNSRAPKLIDGGNAAPVQYAANALEILRERRRNQGK